jgi:hypothetical protein
MHILGLPNCAGPGCYSAKACLQHQDGLAFSKRNQKTPLLLACVLQVHSFLPHGVRHSVPAIHFTPTDV